MKIEEEFKKILERYESITGGDFFYQFAAIKLDDVDLIMRECYNLGKNEEDILKKEKELEMLNYPHEQLKLL